MEEAATHPRPGGPWGIVGSGGMRSTPRAASRLGVAPATAVELDADEELGPGSARGRVDLDSAPHPDRRTPLVARARWALATALWPWVLSRIVVGAALALAHELTSGTRASAGVAARVRQGLLGWDAGWYEAIAREGYWGAGHQSLRFFPLVPVLARALSVVPGIGVGTALLVVANLSAFGATASLAALARRETNDPAFARRAAWLLCLAPPAFTLVMGYAESTFILLAVATFWALRARRWWWAALFGLCAATCRPFGVLLVIPALVEVLRGWSDTARNERVARAVSVASPAFGLGAFLGWVGWRYGDALAPLEIQEQGVHRGSLADPIRTLAHDASLLVHGDHLGTALHLPWVLLAICLLAVALRRLPSSYGLFAAAVLAVSLTSANLDGFERYALSAFPLVLAGAALTRSERVERFVLVAAGAGLVGYALLAFTNLYVP